MGNALSLTRQTAVSLDQKSKSARLILGRVTTQTQALKLAKDLAGNFSNLRPDNPARFFDALAQVLGSYPLLVAQEVVDPVIGIARKVEFLSIKALTDWCDQRLAYWQAIASYVPPAPALPKREFTPEEEQLGRDAVRGLARAQRAGELDGLTFEGAVNLGREEREA